MSTFTEQLQSRHAGQPELVKPRGRSIFEPAEPRSGQKEMEHEMPIPPFTPIRELNTSPEIIIAQQPMVAQRVISEHQEIYPERLNTSSGPDLRGQTPVVKPRLDVLTPLENTPFSQRETNQTGQEKSDWTTQATITRNKDVPNDAQQSPPITPKVLVSPRSPELNSDWMQSLKTAANAWLQSEAKPVIRVSIGRLEVRVPAAPPAPQPKNSAPPTPKMTLEDYLNKQKSNGK